MVERFQSSIIVVQLRACDFDWSKYVNNSKYLQLLEQGRWSWAASNKIDIVHSHLIGVVSQMHIQYKVPILWEPLKDIYISTEAKKIKHYSLLLAQKIYDEDKVYAEADITLSLFNTIEKQPEKLAKIIG